ncbi:MAG TPA: tRNA dihydrouridine synthase DusB [Gemmataceae bacterium]|nr:tRNA dihydrouridine synthase DusB [Gemmataceae bacterium]
MLRTDALATRPADTLRWGSLELPSRYLLAPLAGYTNLAFRLAVRELGGLGLATTDLVNARALLLTSRKTMELIQTCPEDRPVAVQIYGSVPEEMRDAAQWLQDYGVSSVDINMGCPVHKVVRGGGGSAMMCDAARTVNLVRAVVEAVRIPVSVKMRLGWDDQSWSAPFFAREFEKAGVAGVTIHGRTRAQGFGGTVNLDGIRAVVEAVERIPVIGNGDVRTLAGADEMLRGTGCAGVAIGRGALLNPWIFAQLRRREETGEPGPGGSYEQCVDFMHRHFHLLVEQRGERFGCLTFRKVANWYCRVLRPGRDIQQRLVRIESVAEFDGIVEEVRERGRLRPNHDWLDGEPIIAVPKGPNERW